MLGPTGEGPLGDGKDERTRWLFDFSELLDVFGQNHAEFAVIDTALLTLTVQVGGADLSTDLLNLNEDDAGQFMPPELLSLSQGQSATVTIDLLQYVPSDGIISALLARKDEGSEQYPPTLTGEPGELMFAYQDDLSIVSSSLTLSFETCEVEGGVKDLSYRGGIIRADPFAGVSATLYRDGVLLETQDTDSEGNYEFTETEAQDGYSLIVTDFSHWGLKRAWRDLAKSDLYKQVRLPSTMMKQLDELADTLSVRSYEMEPVYDLIRPGEYWADTSFTDEAAEVDTALARLITANWATLEMFNNNKPVGEELGTGMAELFGFMFGVVQSLFSKDPTLPTSLTGASAGFVQQHTQAFFLGTVIDPLSQAVLAAVPDSSSRLKRVLTEVLSLVKAEMQSTVASAGINWYSVVKSVAVQVGKQLGGIYVMEEGYVDETQVNGAVGKADAFGYQGKTAEAWHAVLQAAEENREAADDAASYSELFRDTAGDWGGAISFAESLGGRLRILARVLQVVQGSGYVGAIGLTAWQLYDTVEKDLPHAIDLAFDPDATPPVGAMNSGKASVAHLDVRTKFGAGTGHRSASQETQDLEQAIEAYLLAVDGLVALAEGGDENAFTDQLLSVIEAAGGMSQQLSRAHLPVLAASTVSGRAIPGLADAHYELLDAMIVASVRHLAFIGAALGVMDAELTANDLDAYADTLQTALAAVPGKYENVSSFASDLTLPAFLGVTQHSMSVDSVEAGVPFTLRATIRNGGAALAQNVRVTLVPHQNVDLEGESAADLGDLNASEEQQVEWIVAAHDTASSSAYRILIQSDNGNAAPFVGSFLVTGASSVGREDDEIERLPAGSRLFQAYPNPFNDVVTLQFALVEPAYVELELFDIFGRRVRTLVQAQRNAGVHEVTLNAVGLSSGAYFCLLRTPGRQSIVRMILVR